MTTQISPAPPSATEGHSVFFSRSPFHSAWFVWRTLEFLLALGADVFVVVKYWGRLTPHMANILILVIGVFMVVFPYRTLVRTCGQLQELCQRAEPWDNEHKSLLTEMASAAQRAVGHDMTRYYTTVLMLLIFVTYCVIRRT
jgi:hypothetical protein